MKKVVMFLVILSLLVAAAMAGEKAPAVGDIYRSFKVDLDNNGYLENIDVRIYAIKDEGWYARILVYDRHMNLTWSSPDTSRTVNQMLFGSWDWGTSIPEVIGDLDGDSKVEMLVPAPVSDVRPVPFRLYRWNGKAFQYLSQRALVALHSDETRFNWTATPNYEGRWIGSFEKINSDGTCLVKIWEYRSGAEQCKVGKALVRADKKGFRVIGKITPVK